MLAAGWDAAYAAAYAAARAYGKAPLEPTRRALQDSALALVERMIALREADPAGSDPLPEDAPPANAPVQPASNTGHDSPMSETPQGTPPFNPAPALAGARCLVLGGSGFSG